MHPRLHTIYNFTKKNMHLRLHTIYNFTENNIHPYILYIALLTKNMHSTCHRYSQYVGVHIFYYSYIYVVLKTSPCGHRGIRRCPTATKSTQTQILGPLVIVVKKTYLNVMPILFIMSLYKRLVICLIFLCICRKCERKFKHLFQGIGGK